MGDYGLYTSQKYIYCPRGGTGRCIDFEGIVQADYKPILIETPREFSEINIYFIHDLHRSDPLFNAGKYDAVKKKILSAENNYVCWLGDIMNGAIPGGKTEMFGQTMTPQEEKEWFANELIAYGNRTLCVIDGNHEYNRFKKFAGLHPLYDACVIAGVADKYRGTYAIIDSAVGTRTKDINQQVRYVGFVTHKSKDLKSFGSFDWIDGIDWFASGHDHDPKSHPRAKLVYNTKRKTLSKKNIETINSGSFLEWGGYASQAPYRPMSDAMWTLKLSGGSREISSSNFYV